MKDKYPYYTPLIKERFDKEVGKRFKVKDGKVVLVREFTKDKDGSFIDIDIDWYKSEWK